jgi:hypothetical protein
MPYILNKTNGTILTTVQDATVDNTTSLTFVGKNFTGYGQSIEENFVHLLENFASSTANASTKPIAGQLWFNTSTQQLNISPTGVAGKWKGIGSISIGSTSTVNTSPTNGDMWWDQSLASLIVYNGSSYVNIGPSSTSSYASWTLGSISDTSNNPVPAIVGNLQNQSGGPLVPMVVFSNAVSYATAPASSYNTNFPIIKRGITLYGANSVSGSSSDDGINGYIIWGTAAESVTTKSVQLTPATAIVNSYIPFAGGTSFNGSPCLTTSSSFTYNPSTGVINATATAAYYADIAERYEADAVYDAGTVLVIGGDKEVTVTTIFADTRVAGIVSKNPAYMMNSEAGTDETHPYIALKGRVPCKVQGYIKKGDLIVTSSTPGYGIAASSVFGGAIIGKALGTQSEGFGVIEVLVV